MAPASIWACIDMTFSPFWRKLLLTLHVVTSVGLIGAVAAFLILAIIGATAVDPTLVDAAYLGMSMITWPIIVPLAFASLLIGVVQSLGTPWGLFRYYWVIVKLVLTGVATVVLLIQTPIIGALAQAAHGGDLTPLASGRFAMMLHSAGGMVVLLLATVLSIYKPRGMTTSRI